MKLATFTHEGATRIGIVEGGEILDLSAAEPELPREMVSLLEAGPDALQRAHAAVGRSSLTKSSKTLSVSWSAQ